MSKHTLYLCKLAPRIIGLTDVMLTPEQLNIFSQFLLKLGITHGVAMINCSEYEKEGVLADLKWCKTHIYNTINEYRPILVILFGENVIKQVLAGLKHIPKKMGYIVKKDGILFYLAPNILTVQKTNMMTGVIKGHIKRLNEIILPKLLNPEEVLTH